MSTPTSAATVGVVTIVAGRRQHLKRQLEGLTRQARPADQVVIVRMDDEPVSAPLATMVIDVPAIDGRLPLAAARNAGVWALDTDVVVLLDADCIPGAGLVAGYARAADTTRGLRADGLICGVVRYLSPGVPSSPEAAGTPEPAGTPEAAGAAEAADVLEPAGVPEAAEMSQLAGALAASEVPTDSWTEAQLIAGSQPHPDRPLPAPGTLQRDDQHELTWTTSLALNLETFHRLGGFDERFLGYGASDTDFGVRAREAGLGVWWTGDAVAYHQDQDSQHPPVRHLADIVRNAKLFANLHGWYPMQGWLTAFDREGLVEFDPATGRLELAAW